MLFSISFRGETIKFDLPEDTQVHVLGETLSKRLGLALHTVKLLIPGQSRNITAEGNTLTLPEVGIHSGSKLKMLASSAEDVAKVENAKDLPGLASFEHENQRAAQRSAVSGGTLVPPPGSQHYTFQRFEVWQLPGLVPSHSEALKLLYQLAADPGIIGIMSKYKWKVALLSEMPPAGKVGVSPVCVLGVNVNKGQEISLRLRTDDLKGFRKYDRIKETLIHELAHMVHSDHDTAFKELNSQLRREAEQFDWKKPAAGAGGGAVRALSRDGSVYTGPMVHQPTSASTATRDGLTLRERAGMGTSQQHPATATEGDARSAAAAAALRRAGVDTSPLKSHKIEAKSPSATDPPPPPQHPKTQAQQMFKKGDYVRYTQRDGSKVTAQVMAVDVSVQPPSYGIEINGNYRETEADRLEPLVDEEAMQQPVEGLGHRDAATEAKEEEVRRRLET